MSLAKAVVTGTLYRAPEERYTQNNIAVWSFVLNIGDRDEMLIRVISRRTALEDIVSNLSKGDKVLVEGRLQTAEVKMDDGSDKRILEIDASSIEAFGGSGASASHSSDYGTDEEVVKIDTDTFSEELIDEGEIPF